MTSTRISDLPLVAPPRAAPHRARLLAEIRSASPELVRELAARTADWYDENGQPVLALPHVLAAGDPERVADFLCHRGMAMVLEGHGGQMFTQLERSCPGLAEDPFVWVLRAVDAVTHEDPEAACAFLDLVDSRAGVTDSMAPPEWLTVLTRAARVDAAPDRDDLGDLHGTGQPDIDCYLAAQAATATLLRGDRERAEAQLRRGLALAAGADRPRAAVRAVTRLAVTAGYGGAVTTMRERARKALVVAEDHELRGSTDALHARALAAFGAYLQGDSYSPRDLEPLARTREHRDGSVRPVGGWAAQVIGRLLAFRAGEDRYAGAEALRHSMLSLLEYGGPFPVSAGDLLAHVVWALLEVREPRTARLLIGRARTQLGDTPQVETARVMLAVSTETVGATPVVGELLTRADDLGPVERITAWLLHSAVHADQRQRNPHRVRNGLERALELAADSGVIRPFLDVPGTIALLDERVGGFGHRDELVARIRNHPQARRRPPEQQLTATELTVLHYLPSGRTAQQIAAELGVSINTVKTHLRAIYAKFGVGSRTAALAQARRAGLL
ncbi:LuxR C-terminal-related transcriptional regulator [Nocardia yamanashiensis]|uniref:LuxR C-terminal-related transcriptional regulator n=1 Tax=Nocardia yamanashiensis TaxID=209247 RepID=UPI001E4322D2|nr:LuxR C-terminal-related transcriptional regulator [Nocardia yamanashiensis]UGT38473.1 LuxR C-terminal-related transcriptional regulator [Nocardia yamanashiensis]